MPRPDPGVLACMIQLDLGDDESIMVVSEKQHQLFIDPTNPDNIRPDIRAAIDRYALGRDTELGGFLTAVMEDRLVEAVGRADLDNQRSIAAIAAYVYNKVPMVARGSRDRVTRWQQQAQEARVAQEHWDNQRKDT